MNRTYVIGDIHGCAGLLNELLEKISLDADQDDTILFIGDYIDRGPDSKGVIDRVLRLMEDHGRVIPLMGNHELMLLNAMRGINQEEFLAVGGLATLHSYGISPDKIGNMDFLLPASHRAFLEDLLPYWEGAEHIFVHAGLQPGVHLTQQSPDWLFWARDNFIHTDYDFGKIVVYGHTPFDKPQVDGNKIGIDTGAVYGNALTCLVLPDTSFISIKSRNQP